MNLSEAGLLVQQTWEALPDRFSCVAQDAFVVMPKHVHGIIVISAASGVGAQQAAPLPASLAEIIRAFKSLSAIAVNRVLSRSGQPLWQRNYYEHIIRDDASFGRIRQYIINNPAKWHEDKDNPRNW